MLNTTATKSSNLISGTSAIAFCFPGAECLGLLCPRNRVALARGSPVPVPIPGAGVSREVAAVIIERNNVTSPEAKFLIKVMGENRIHVAYVKTIAARISC